MSETSATNDNINMEDEFKIAVRNYVTLMDELNEIQNGLKEKKQRVKKLGEFILEFMKTNEKEICNLGDSGTLERKRRKKKQTLNKTVIENLLNEFFNDKEKASESTRYIFDNQQVTETEILHRSN